MLALKILEIKEEPVIKEGDPGTEGNIYGFEGGTIIRLNSVIHLFTAEVCCDPKVVKTRLAYWKSKDGLRFSRVKTLFESSGNFDGSDPRASLWSPMPIFNDKSNKWNLFYVCYRAAPPLPGKFSELTFRHNMHGIITRAESVREGIEGIEGPYEDKETALQPGENSDWWEGIQGTDSFYPYKVDDRWLSFYGSWRSNNVWNDKLWFGVGLVSANSLEGPWSRLSAYNPVLLDPFFVENPIVIRLPDGEFLSIYDTGPENDSIGYATSADGVNWKRGKLIGFPPGKPSWRGVLRTPLCLLPEKDNMFSIYYTAFNKKGFLHNEEPRHHSGFGTIGLIKVKAF